MTMLTHDTMLERNATWRGDDPALRIVDDDRTLSYAAFNRRVNRVASALDDRGVGPGDRVAMVLFNTEEFPVTLYACYTLGAVPVPLNYRLATDTVAYVLSEVSPSAVVYDDEVAATVEPAADDTPRGPHLVRVGSPPEAVAGESYADLHASGTAESLDRVPADAGDPSYVLYTSGTTGEPKGVVVTNETARERVQQSATALGLDEESVALQTSPWFHAGGIDLTVHPTLAVGGTLLVTRDWSPESVLQTVESAGVTHLVTVPTVATRLVDHDSVTERDCSTLDCLMCMGSPLSDDLAESLKARVTPNVYNGYGTTESLLDTVLRPESLPEHAGSAGRPTLEKRVRVVELSDVREVPPYETVPPGEPGEVVVKGGQTLDRYYGDADATREAFVDGWFYTGDVGVVDEDGYLTLTGRADDVIQSGGELVSPVEVESALTSHEAVADALVVGVADDEWGERVTAYVVARSGASLDATTLDEFCRAHDGLADYKRPRAYEFVSDLELTATGKKQRFKYRTRAGAD